MKKIALLLISIGLLICLAACGEKTTAVDTTEFSLKLEDATLALGQQSGAFPWGTAMEEKSSRFWSADGSNGFEVVAKDGTKIRGTREESTGDTTDADLFLIVTKSRDWQTYRGAYVGMSMDKVLALYPEAVRRDGDGPGVTAYEYTTEETFFYQLIFNFEKDKLAEITLANGIDGFMY